MATEVFEAGTKAILTATTQVKTNRGKCGRLIVVASTGLEIRIYDDPAAANNEVFRKAALAAGESIALQIPMDDGIRVVFQAGTGQVVLTYS